MKIRFVVSHFFPENNALTNRLIVLLPLLARRHDVSVVYLLEPGKPFDPVVTAKQFELPRVKLHPVQTGVYDKASLWRRLFGEVWNNLRLWRVARQESADVTWVSVPQLMLLPVSALFVRLVRGRTILELRDLTWHYIPFGEGSLGRLSRHLVDYSAALAIRAFDEVVTVTEAQAEYVRAQTGKSATVVRNGISRSIFRDLQRLPRPAFDRKRLIIAYIGTLGHSQNILTMVKAAALLRAEEGLRFLIVGSGPGLAPIKDYIRSQNLTNVELAGRQPWAETLRAYQRADILYAQLRSAAGLKSAEPTKIFEYATAGRPFIYGGAGLGADLASRFEHSRTIPPDDPDVLAAMILKVADYGAVPVSDRDMRLLEQEFIRENIYEAFLGRRGW
jgi:glycosyltransferase involved in cell wall biosynthesis